MAITDLRLEDSIKLWTPTGESEIQLMYGDITKLPVEDKVDLIMISAFQGDYAAVRRTVLGALWHNLGINVQDLAMNKELDVRSLFNCWLSGPFPSHTPYNRLLCFERKRGPESLSEQIRGMFRVFVPVLSNKETTVITPLLATGNQGYSKTKSLSAMVEGAAGWITAGLAIKSFKIVIYESQNQAVNNLFKELQKKWTKISNNLRNKHEEYQKCQFDIFIMFNKSDQKSVSKVTSTLKKKKQNLNIYADVLQMDAEKIWQEDIYKNMIWSNRIIAILTPSFVESQDCLELFNMAMCCCRLRKREMLIPLYIDTVESMPVYMGLVQYIDCREKKEGDKTDAKIVFACSKIIDGLNENKDTKLQVAKLDKHKMESNQEEKYDIFISYSHKNPKEANYLLNLISESNPDLKIFFDRNELTMGSLWQATLYQALSTAQCIISLISMPYITSTVCQEEYNIALARHMSENDDILFIPLCIEELSSLPCWFSRVKMADARGDKFSGVAQELTSSTLDWLQNRKIPEFLDQENKNWLNIGEIYPLIREKEVEEKYTIEKKSESIEPKKKLGSYITLTDAKNKRVSSDIAVSYAHDSIFDSVFLGHFIEKHLPDVNISYISDDTHGRMNDFDTARKIVIFLSSDFVHSAQHMQELHVALCRQRASKGAKILHIIQATPLPEKPAFLHLFPCETSIKDAFWERLANENIKRGSALVRKSILSKREDFQGTFSCSLPEYLALMKASYDVLEGFTVDNQQKFDNSMNSYPNQVNVWKMQLKADDNQRHLLDKTLTTDECVVKVPITQADEKKEQINSAEEKPSTEDHSTKMDNETFHDTESVHPHHRKVHFDVNSHHIENSTEMRNNGRSSNSEKNSRSCSLL